MSITHLNLLKFRKELRLIAWAFKFKADQRVAFALARIVEVKITDVGYRTDFAHHLSQGAGTIRKIDVQENSV